MHRLNIGKIEQIDMEARLYLNLGVTKEYLEEYDDTEMYFEKALSLCRKNDLFDLLHRCYLTTALFVHNKREDATKALRLLNLALGVAERLDKSKICETLLTKSEIFIKIGDFQSARQVLHKAYKLKTSVQNDRECIERQLKTIAAMCYTEDGLITTSSTDYAAKKKLFETLGDGACQLRNYSKAVTYYLNMLKNAELCMIEEKELVPIYVSLYQTYIDLKEYEEALKYMSKEFDLIKDNAHEAISTLLNIADVYEQSGKDFWDIDNVYQRARNECQRVFDLKLEKNVIRKIIAVRQKHNMNTLVEMMKDEAAMSNINLDDDEDEVTPTDEDEETNSIEKNTPDIGEDIDLDNLSGSESDEERQKEQEPKYSTRRRGPVSLTIKRNEKGETQLHQACISGNVSQVSRLLDQGHPVNIRDFAGWMPLHEAANHGHIEIVRLLIERYAPINDKGGKMCDGVTALHDACGNGYLDVVEALLDAGANATLRTDFNDTPLSTLIKWREQQQLDMAEQIFYDTIRERLMKHIEQTGKIDLHLSRANQTPIKYSNVDGRTPSTSSKSPLKSPSFVSSRIRPSIKNESSSDDDDSSREDSKTPTIDHILNKEFPSAEKNDSEPIAIESSIDATKEYRTAIDTVRNGLKISPLKLSDSNKRRAGILDSEDVGENWLEKDIITRNKKTVFKQ